jgi:pilus assembly protein CpaC
MTARILILVALLVAAAAAAPHAGQAPLPIPPLPATAAPAFPQVHIATGGSTVLTTEFAIRRIAVTNAAVANATVVEPMEILLDGKSPGTVSLIIWGENGRRVQYDVIVNPPPSELQQQIRALFPDEQIHVAVSADAIVLAGRPSTNEVSLRIAEIAAKSSAKSQVINLMQQTGAAASQQVMLQVRLAEVDQRAMTEVGASLFTSPAGFHDWVGRTTTQQFAAPDFDTKDNELTFTDFLNLFVLNTKYDLGIAIKALQARGYFQSLAEPTLIAYNGQEASFLAGGEIPVPISQGITGAVSVTYKEFGIRLTFRPEIAGDVIRLRVRPEVSSLDFANGITLAGFRIPALTTRRAETEVELRDGQTFAIGGLMNNVSQEDGSKIPLLGDVPILGALFRSRAERKERTELIVLITPRLVRPLNPNEVPPVPTRPERFLPAELPVAQGQQP